MVQGISNTPLRSKPTFGGSQPKHTIGQHGADLAMKEIRDDLMGGAVYVEDDPFKKFVVATMARLYNVVAEKNFATQAPGRPRVYTVSNKDLGFEMTA